MEENNLKNLFCYTKDSTTREPTAKGSLSGLSFALKDLCAVRGHVSSFGHAQWRATHEPAKADSHIVDTLLAAGAHMEGITKLEQLAISLIGNIGEDEAPLNTTHPERYCGGSSSGSASAVAGGLVDFAVGSDTGGSVRLPAAACGLYGNRTTAGVISKTGVTPLAESFDVLGFLTRDPETLLKVTESTADTVRCEIKTIFVPTNLEALTSRYYAAATRKEVERLAQKHGLEVVPIANDVIIDPSIGELLARIQSREIWTTHAEWVTANKHYLDENVQVRLGNVERLAADSTVVVAADNKASADYTERIHNLLGLHSLLALPVMPMSGPNINWSEQELADFRKRTFLLSAPSSLSGLPQLSAPIVGATTNIGIIGPKNSDADLIRLYT